MQDSGYGYPPVEDRSQRLPLLLCALAATNQNVSPEPIYALSLELSISALRQSDDWPMKLQISACSVQNLLREFAGSKG